jgi:hypothetical protein
MKPSVPSITNSFTPTGTNFPRERFLAILRAGLSAAEHRFVVQSALQWLAAFPGDLQTSLAYARALQGEGRTIEARNVARGLCRADPENLEALQLWQNLEEQLSKPGVLNAVEGQPGKDVSTALNVPEGGVRSAIEGQPQSRGKSPQPGPADLANWIAALGGSRPAQQKGSGWGERLLRLRKHLEAGNLEQANTLLPELLGQDLDIPLVALTHLRSLQASPDSPLTARRSLAEFYQRRFPDCLPIQLLLADWLLQEGVIERAVSLLHQSAARDISGEVARRVLGPSHPYRSLWPEKVSLPMELVIPASVSAALGWNQLASGELAQVEAKAVPTSPASEAMAGQDPTQVTGPTLPTARQEQVLSDAAVFRKALDHMAEEIGEKPPSQFEGRFPVYVIFSIYQKLVEQYSAAGAESVKAEMQRLAEKFAQRKTVNGRGPWGAFVFLPDLLESAGALGLPTLSAFDPWSVKLALADLDQALGKKGEMIGALLIVGGPEIVPFHNLPNPVDDPDSEVFSDNPYASRDQNYFIPEWPVGRLPNGSGSDPQPLLAGLKRIQERQAQPPKRSAAPQRWLAWITRWIPASRQPTRKGFGYTAAVWRNASFQVYRPVGEARAVLVSPPKGVNGSSPSAEQITAGVRTGSNGANRRNGNQAVSSLLPAARLGYFNLHGLADSAEWYGQRDPLGSESGPDYPVALRLEDVKALGKQAPLVVFSEACYGAHIEGKTIDQALSLQFLNNGSQAVVGSTTMSYGAINTPLIAADLLGYNFWKGLLEGLPAGEALQRAKIQLASEMHSRQGYLDGEDQKTLISFILLGDPLLQLSEDVRSAKRLRRLISGTLQVKTICDRSVEVEQDTPLPAEVLSTVKQVVANYLPGMADAQATYSTERAVCTAHGHECPTSQLGCSCGPNGKSGPAKTPQRRLVVLNKSFEKAGLIHPQFARLTLDPRGKLVKVVVSR